LPAHTSTGSKRPQDTIRMTRTYFRIGTRI
jgi:hypothetical protein